MAFPATPLDVTVELAIGADIHADPATWAWTDVTTSIREKQKIGINRGRRNRIGNFPPTRVNATADNTNGNLCRHNPLGAYFGQLKKNTPMRVSVDNGSGPVVRGAVYVPGFPPSWDPSEQDQIVTLQGVGITDRLGRSKPLRSAMFRTMSGITPADVVPHVYWSLEDGSGATQAASGLANGHPMSVTSSIEFAANSDLVGSDALPTLAAGATLTGLVPSYVDVGKWFLNVAINVPTEPGAQATLMEVRTTGGTIAFWRLLLTPGSPSQLEWQAYGADGVALVDVNEILVLDGSGGGKPTEAQFYGSWFFLVLGSVQRSATVVGASAGMTNGTSFPSVGGFQNTGTHGRITSIRLGSGTVEFSAGHLGLFVDTAFAEASGSNQNVSAFLGHKGEMAHDRAERLCREERVQFTTAATTSQAMGAQGTSRLLDLLRECANADQGLLYENLNFGLTYVSSSERYNLSPAITLNYSASEILPPWDPDDDDQDYYNEVTASRPGGSSYTAADEDEVDDVGQFADGINPNVETDLQLPDVAGWRLNLGLNDELTWPAVRPNLTGGGSLLDDWLDTDLGQHMHVTGHPSPLAPDTIKQVIEGYSETLGSYLVSVSANLSPADPWTVAELDDDVLGKLDTDGSDLTAAVNSSATALSVATQTGTSPLWPTDAGEMPIPLIVAGEVMSATAIAAPTTVTFGAAGTAAHASNASVTPGIPASVATGNLLLCLAAIRNSGTGVPDTPSGYTRLEVFASTDNVQLFAKVATSSGEVAPTVTFTGGVANATTSAQMCRIAGVFSAPAEAFVIAATQLNASAQNVGYPCLALTRPQLDTTIDNAIVVYVGWKQDDWTSVAAIAGATEIGEPSSTTGDDQGLVWDYTIQTTATDIVPGSFVVTGGASAISRGAVVAIRSNVQAVTVTRSVNGVVKAQLAGEAVNVHKPARLAL